MDRRRFKLIMVYKDDVIQALQSYIIYNKSREIYFDSLTFSEHYCNKYGLSLYKYKAKITKIYNEYMRANT